MANADPMRDGNVPAVWAGGVMAATRLCCSGAEGSEQGLEFRESGRAVGGGGWGAEMERGGVAA